MKNIETRNINKLYQDFINAVEEYTYQRKNSDHISDIINQGLGTFIKYPLSESVSLFLLNDLTFEFEHNKTLPEIFSSENIHFFEKLVDMGVVGNALESGHKQVFDKDDILGEDFIIFPLITSNSGVVGLLIMILLEHIEPKNKTTELLINNLHKMSSILSSLFATVIENSLFFQNLNKAQSLLEQKVAARTMSLIQGKRELQIILNTLQTGILLVESETGKIVNSNPIAQQIIGLDQDELIGQLYTDFFAPGDEGSDLSPSKGNYESIIRNVNGDSIPVLRNISDIYLGSQKFRIESFNDITERKRAETALKKSNELLELKVQERTIDLQLLVHKLKEEVNEREKAEKELRRMLETEKEVGDLKTRFISLVSHEFRTPMTIIRSAAQMIEKFKDKLSDNEKTEKIKRILVTVDTMADILENVLFIGKTDSGTINLNPREVDLSSYCSNIINDLKLGLDTDRQFNITLPSGFSSLYVDSKLIRHILFNLISNAIKYSPENSPIDFTLEVTDAKCVLTVTDYGIGIPSDEQEKIFELFYRARNSGSIPGTGLGMSVIIRSIKLHGGKLELSSRENAGTTFIVSLPNLKNIEVDK
jgi:PAS domain S-box-containing protein